METIDPIQDHSIFDMVTGSGPVVQSVLIMLIIISIWSWAITIAKSMQFKRARKESKEFSSIFWETRNFARVDDSSRRLLASPLSRVFESGYRELTHLIQDTKDSPKRLSANLDVQLATVEHALKRAEFDETEKLERGLTFLASVASAAPFIGLFGTVWGIMNAFHGLSSAQSTTIQAVAPGISEALVATAIGLAAAIPAAVAYNYLLVAVKQFRAAMQGFSEEFLDIAKQSLSLS